MQRTNLTQQILSKMQQSILFLFTDEFFIHILLCHRLYISIVDFFFTSCCTLSLQTDYLNFHANLAISTLHFYFRVSNIGSFIMYQLPSSFLNS